MKLRGVELNSERIQVVGCYELSLYCGATDCDRKEKLNNLDYQFPDDYNGRNYRECAKDAASDGWTVRGLTALCPHCTRKAAKADIPTTTTEISQALAGRNAEGKDTDNG